MAMHTIQVDDDVMEFLRQNAEPFVDTPNSVLRRALSIETAKRPGRVPVPVVKSASIQPSAELTSIPIEFPEALRQTLEVVQVMRRQGVDRSYATRLIASRHGVARETVADKYCRQLGLTAAQLDRMLAEASLDALSARLRGRFSQHADAIRKVIATLRRETA